MNFYFSCNIKPNKNVNAGIYHTNTEIVQSTSFETIYK